MNQLPTLNTRYLLADGKVTERLRSDLGLVLCDYVDTARFWSEKREKPASDYAIREAHVVGSILRSIDDSDVDLLLIANDIDADDYRFVKQVMAQRFFSNRPKVDAIDVFVRPYDEFPERPHFDVTDQVRDLLSKCNEQLGYSAQQSLL